MTDSNTEQSEIPAFKTESGFKTIPNLFEGKTEAELKNARFPQWDIIPPNQFINPRIKS